MLSLTNLRVAILITSRFIIIRAGSGGRGLGVKRNKARKRKGERHVKNGTHGGVFFVGKVSCRIKKW
jgi:hypothetical protein